MGSYCLFFLTGLAVSVDLAVGSPFELCAYLLITGHISVVRKGKLTRGALLGGTRQRRQLRMSPTHVLLEPSQRMNLVWQNLNGAHFCQDLLRGSSSLTGISSWAPCSWLPKFAIVNKLHNPKTLSVDKVGLLLSFMSVVSWGVVNEQDLCGGDVLRIFPLIDINYSRRKAL